MPENPIMSSEEVSRSARRIAHEIMEAHEDLSSLLLVGIRTRGVPLALRIACDLNHLDSLEVPVGALDISLHRDDRTSSSSWPLVLSIDIPVDIQDREVVLVDDVLYTGRSVRAALDVLTNLGRPKRVQLAVLVDRGHRELPIRPDYVGKNIPTSRVDTVKVRLTETDGKDEVVVIGQATTQLSAPGRSR